MMALFSLLWVLRVRSQFRKEKRKDKKHAIPCVIAPVVCNPTPHSTAKTTTTAAIVLPPPVNFADDDDVDDHDIPPPPPPPICSNSLNRMRMRKNHLQSQSRSVHSLPIECTCPTDNAFRRGPAVVRFRDDPLGIRSARGHSWSLASALSTLPRRSTTSSHFAQGITSPSLA